VPDEFRNHMTLQKPFEIEALKAAVAAVTK
jgi:hypothetical protein